LKPRLKKIGRYWHQVYTDDAGATRTISTGQASEREARRFVNESKRFESEVGIREAGEGKLTCESALDMFRQHMLNLARSSKTIHEYVASLFGYLESSGSLKTPPAAITAQQWASWINPASDIKSSTRKLRLAALRAFYGFLQSKGLVRENTGRLIAVNHNQLTHEQREKSPKRALLPKEIDELVRYFEGLEDRFWLFAVRCSYETGLRLGDIAQLEWSCFRRPMHVEVWTDKSNKRLSLPISPQLVDLLDALPGAHERFLFPEQRAIYINPSRRSSLSVYFGRVCCRLGLVGASFHSLRRSKATEDYRLVDKLALAGRLADALTVKQIQAGLGHSSPSTTSGYIENQTKP
jgi:integrase